jgi:hypothetical protein
MLAALGIGTTAAHAQTQTFTTSPSAATELGFGGTGSYFTLAGGTGFGTYGVSSGSAAITTVERTIPPGTAAGSLFSFDLENPSGSFNTTSSVQVLLNIDRAGFVQQFNINASTNVGSYTFTTFAGGNDGNTAITKAYSGSSTTVTAAATSGGPSGQRPVTKVTVTLPAALATAGRYVTARVVLNSASTAVLVIDNLKLTLANGTTSLPVELTRFEATAKGPGVSLAWNTASEKNSDRFEIQRSATGEAYETLSLVKGQGNTTMAHEYSFVDSRPLAGTSYYRLRQVDTDGTFSFSPVAAVQADASTKAEFYPNPSASQLILPTGVGAVQYRIFNALGQTLLSGKATDNDRLDISSLPKGPFFLELSGAAGHHTQRLLRE